MERPPALRLADAFDVFMRYFLVHLNPMVHRAEYQGRALTEKQIIALLALDWCGSLTPGEISRAVNVSKGSLTAILRALGRAGLVVRRDRDGRSYELELSDEGKKLTSQIIVRRENDFQNLFAAMNSAQVDEVVRGFTVLSNYLQKKEDES